jgi:hypothetical protein
MVDTGDSSSCVFCLLRFFPRASSSKNRFFVPAGNVEGRNMRSVQLSLGIVVLLLACGLISISLARTEHQDFDISQNPTNQTVSDSARASELCPVTRPPSSPFVPQPPRPEKPGPGEFWFGTEALWTTLPINGVWTNLPHDNSGYTQKMSWISREYDWRVEPKPQLIVNGRCLAQPLQRLPSFTVNNAYSDKLQSVMAVGLKIPAPGCWENLRQITRGTSSGL